MQNCHLLGTIFGRLYQIYIKWRHLFISDLIYWLQHFNWLEHRWHLKSVNWIHFFSLLLLLLTTLFLPPAMLLVPLPPPFPTGRSLPTQAATCTHPSCNKYSKVVRDAIVFSCPTWSTPDQVSQPRKFLPGLPHLEQIVNMCLTKIYNYKSSMYDTLLQLSPSNRDNSWGCCLSGTCAASQSSLRGLCNGQWIQGARFYQPDTDYIKDRHT